MKQADIDYIDITVLETRGEKVQNILDDLHRIKVIKKGVFFNFVTYKENKGRYLFSEIINLFAYSSWQELVNVELGIYKLGDTRFKNNSLYYSEKELFDEMKRVWKKLNKRPTYNQFTLNTAISPLYYVKKYKTWSLCVKRFYSKNITLLSLHSVNTFHLSKDSLLEELKRIIKIHQNENLSFKQYKELGGKYSLSSFYTHFGSWKKALQNVGLKSKNSNDIIPR